MTVGAAGALETAYDVNNPNGNLTLGARCCSTRTTPFTASVSENRPLCGKLFLCLSRGSLPRFFPATWTRQSGSSVSSGSEASRFWQAAAANSFLPGIPQFEFRLELVQWRIGLLLQATNISGPWSPVTGASSPYTNLASPSAPQLFFRLQASDEAASAPRLNARRSGNAQTACFEPRSGPL